MRELIIQKIKEKVSSHIDPANHWRVKQRFNIWYPTSDFGTSFLNPTKKDIVANNLVRIDEVDLDKVGDDNLLSMYEGIIIHSNMMM